MSSPSIFRTLAILFLSLIAAGCTTLPSFSGSNYVSPMDGAQVVDNSTRYTRHLECIKPVFSKSPHGETRFAVGRVSDFTGKEDLTNGKRLTQGASLMVISALNRAGASLVERFDTSISDMELKYSDNKLITDNLVTQEYRRLMSGSLPGSDYHVVGGITEVNYNIRSGSFDSSVRFVALGARYFVMNIAVDLRLVNTKTLEVVNNQSLQKQIIGTELSSGFFRIFSEGTVDLAASERTQEPIQRGIRMVLEQAVFNMLNETFALKANSCLKAEADPVDTPRQTSVTANEIELTTPVAKPLQNEEKRLEEKVLIDTHTGEAYYAETNPVE
ncbi:MAG: CsgG/HfaB family protein, partial [Limnobacter sp.]|nr:CsgG/HfaB family protein [Limnobacter sp.]